ncbi:MAG: hypothetical protein KKA19_02240 [Candidatus Margulisbacteria bacterium]|nr:hypothetical protein [Candidatus Margulisiibacteriota bacterium]
MRKINKISEYPKIENKTLSKRKKAEAKKEVLTSFVKLREIPQELREYTEHHSERYFIQDYTQKYDISREERNICFFHKGIMPPEEIESIEALLSEPDKGKAVELYQKIQIQIN